MKRLHKKNYDIWIIFGGLLLAALLWLGQAWWGARALPQGQARLLVYVGGEVVETLPIDGEARDYTLEQADGSFNQVRVTARGAYMAHANCPNQDCVAQSAVTVDNYQTRALGSWIICLPNRVSVELRVEDE